MPDSIKATCDFRHLSRIMENHMRVLTQSAMGSGAMQLKEFHADHGEPVQCTFVPITREKMFARLQDVDGGPTAEFQMYHEADLSGIEFTVVKD